MNDKKIEQLSTIYSVIREFSKTGAKNSGYFKHIDYSKEHLLKIYDCIEKQYKKNTLDGKNEFHKWTHQFYMKMTEWAQRTDFDKEIRKKAESLQIAYMAYLATNGGKRKLPTEVVKDLKKFYDMK